VRLLRLDEVPPTFSDGARWVPVRAELGIEAFGVGVYVGEPGEVVVPRHDESGRGGGRHDELYVVLRGRAGFVVDGEELDGPAGTLVFVVAGEVREARAEERGTTVLAIGATPGQAYAVAPWEYGARVDRERQLGNSDRAAAIAAEGIERYGEHPTMLFVQACVAAHRGRRDEAVELLVRALAEGPYIRE
jgi:quercetin dioxygenase-like cupin family protein